MKPGLPIVPPWDIDEPRCCLAGRDDVPPGDYACMTCGDVMHWDAVGTLPPCPQCKGRRWTEAVKAPLGGDIRSAMTVG